MLIPGRNQSSDSYRYGFQGQEKDDEVKGKGNSVNFSFRMHDPRVGRFFSPDPLTKKYPFYSPYQFSGNKVISHKELEGAEELIAILPEGNNSSIFSSLDGEGIMVSIFITGLEKLGGFAEAKSYTFAFKKLKAGKLKGSNGKIYTTTRTTAKTVTLIDGTVYHNVSMGQNFGNKYFTTKGINQIEAFRSNKLKIVSKALNNAGYMFDAIMLVKDTANNDGQIDANSLLNMGVTTYLVSASSVTGPVGFTLALAVGLTIDTIQGIALSEIEAVKQTRRAYILALSKKGSIYDLANEVGKGYIKDDFEILYAPTHVLGDFLTGQIKTLPELKRIIWSDDNIDFEKDSAILIEYSADGEKAYVHKLFLNTEGSIELKKSEKKSTKKE